MHQVCYQMHMSARELVVTINHEEIKGKTAKILSSLSDITQASMNCHQAYHPKKGGK